MRFVVGDLSALDVPAASIDAVTAGYALRNVPDYARGVAEIARVLKPGGVLATLDFYRPESAAWRRLFLAYLSVAGNVVGWLWHRQPVVYGYIARSIDHFVSWQEFSATLAAARAARGAREDQAVRRSRAALRATPLAHATSARG